MPTPAYAPQQTAYIQPCAGQLSYKSLLVKKNSAHVKFGILHYVSPSIDDIATWGRDEIYPDFAVTYPINYSYIYYIQNAKSKTMAAAHRFVETH